MFMSVYFIYFFIVVLLQSSQFSLVALPCPVPPPPAPTVNPPPVVLVHGSFIPVRGLALLLHKDFLKIMKWNLVGPCTCIFGKENRLDSHKVASL